MHEVRGLHPVALGAPLYRYLKNYFTNNARESIDEMPTVYLHFNHPNVEDEEKNRVLTETKEACIREIHEAEQSIYEYLRTNEELQQLLCVPDQIALKYSHRIRNIVSYEVALETRKRELRLMAAELSRDKGKWDRLTKAIEIFGNVQVDDWYFYIKRGVDTLEVYITQDTMDNIVRNGGRYKSDTWKEEGYPMHRNHMWYAGNINTVKKFSSDMIIKYGYADSFYAGQAKNIRCVKKSVVEELCPPIVRSNNE